MDCKTSSRGYRSSGLALLSVRYLSFVATLIVSVLTMVAAPSVGAEEKAYPDKFKLRAGGFHLNDVDTTVFLQAPNAPLATTINFDRSLNMETSTTVARVDAIYRFNNRHAVGATWYRYDLNGRRTISEQIVFGNQTFTVGGDVTSSLKFDIYKLDYRYSLHNDEKVELGVGLGAHLLRIDVAVERPLIGQRKAESLNAPLPVFTLFASYNFTKRLEMVTSYELFFINTGDAASGSLQDFLIGLEYRFIRHVGVGLAFNRFTSNVKDNVDSSQLFVDHAWNGLYGYGAVYF